jgi:hypothetical protein
MRRLFLFLPLCFLLLPAGPRADSARREAAVPLREVADNGTPLQDNEEMGRLARTDPFAFLENCLRRYDREVKGYRATLQKQERLGGTLQDSEVIDVWFQEKPFSVLLDWQRGTRLAQRTLYQKGQNRDKLLVLPAGLFRLVGVVERDPEGPDARRSGRYPLTEFGIKIGTERTLGAFERARTQKALHVEYLGEQRLPEAGDRLCWVLRRTGYTKPEEDGITELTFFVDTENWLQVGSVLRGAHGQLIGEYYFRDIQINPDFSPDTFSRAALTR